MSRITCLYCFEHFRPSDVCYRCINPNPALCEHEPDVALERYRGKPLALQAKVIKRSAPRTSEVVCECGVPTSKALCPHCHNELPHQFPDTDNYIVAIIGARDVGKSHYITVLIHELKNRLGAVFNASLTALDEQTIRRYNQEFRRYVYDAGKTIPATVSARANIEVRYPLVYRLTIDQASWLRRNRHKSVTLVFFDTAGEDLGDFDIMKTENRYIANADGIIFLVDPLQVPALAASMPGHLTTRDTIDQEEIIVRASRLIQDVNNIKANRKIDIPLAVSFSKLDMLQERIDPILLRASRYEGGVDMRDLARVNDLFTAYVEKWMGQNILTFMRQNYETYSFFGVSALGSSPDQQGNLPKGVSPFRIEDPLLWILAQKGLIKTTRRRVRKNAV